ncbi:MAG: cysteine--tRNA ligase [Myxococcales bacterium]|jgi:cysteinyl-tRNA synthetase
MTLRLHDTLSDEVKPFEPAEPGHARIYVCGPTVYDFPHIGHMRSALTYDVLVRHMREQGLKVTFVRNITDIDDKIIARARERGESPMALARRFEDAYHEDTARLGMLEPDHEPRVSDHLAEIHALIQRLIDAGAAYESEGDVYFSVQAFPEYGKLSHRKQSDLSFGASGRLDSAEAERKRHPADFALWKGNAAGEGEPTDGTWDSPWGRGRPGWHIECSAMSMRYLGESFDLHGGGLDLVFPHHENEIAQSEAATGQCLSRFWVHHGFIEVNKEKMSKSLGNFFTARECFRLVEPEALRYFALNVHYRAPLNLDWSVDDAGQVTGFPQIEEAERRVEYVYNTRVRLAAIPDKRISDDDEVPGELSRFPQQLARALDDDLNMPQALAATADFLRHVNELAERAKGKKGKVGRAALQAARDGLDTLGRVLGLGNEAPEAFLERVRGRRAERLKLSAEEIGRRIDERIQARKDKDFARADEIRDALAQLGVELMDGPEGTTWRIP